MSLYKKLLMIDRLNIPQDLKHNIKFQYKYEMLQKNFDRDKINLIQNINYYIFLNKKINKKHKREDTLLKTIKFFD